MHGKREPGGSGGAVRPLFAMSAPEDPCGTRNSVDCRSMALAALRHSVSWPGEFFAVDHRRASGVDGVDDLGAVDALQVDGCDAEAGVAELALDDNQRHAFAGHFDNEARGEAGAERRGRRMPASAATRRICARTAMLDHARPRVGPVTMQTVGRRGAPSERQAMVGVAPMSTRPCRPRGDGRPCRAARAVTRGVVPGRPRRAPALRGYEGLRATALRSIRAAGVSVSRLRRDA
jgi:hypothetical protein